MSKRKHFSKALTILLAVVMVFTMMPAMAWAEGDSGIEGTTPVSQNEEQINITLYGHSAFFSSMKLYKWSGTEKQGEDLLTATERADDKYAL